MLRVVVMTIDRPRCEGLSRRGIREFSGRGPVCNVDERVNFPVTGAPWIERLAALFTQFLALDPSARDRLVTHQAIGQHDGRFPRQIPAPCHFEPDAPPLRPEVMAM